MEHFFGDKLNIPFYKFCFESIIFVALSWSYLASQRLRRYWCCWEDEIDISPKMVSPKMAQYTVGSW